MSRYNDPSAAHNVALREQVSTARGIQRYALDEAMELGILSRMRLLVLPAPTARDLPRLRDAARAMQDALVWARVDAGTQTKVVECFYRLHGLTPP